MRKKRKIVGVTVGTTTKPKALFKKTEQEIQNIVNEALAQAKASGKFDGKDGLDGKDGKDGQDGHTPEKGVDYFTEADKSSFVKDVLNALPTWNGGAF